MEVRIGTQPLVRGSAQLGELRDANALAGDPAALRGRLAEDGYLVLRDFFDRDAVLAARRRMLELLASQGVLAEGSDPGDAVAHPTHRRADLVPAKAYPETLAVLEAPRLFAFFADFFGEPALTFDYKWLRAVEPGAGTGVHFDNVYMGRGSTRLHTVWTPFGDIPAQMGTLVILEGSNHLPAFARLRDTYGRIDVDRDPIKQAGWLTRDPLEVLARYGGRWLTTDFRAGDLVLMTMFTLHCSTINLTDRWRLSCDTRFQPASDPADDRWYGPRRTGHTGAGAQSPDAEPWEVVKQRWGV